MIQEFERCDGNSKDKVQRLVDCILFSTINVLNEGNARLMLANLQPRSMVRRSQDLNDSI